MPAADEVSSAQPAPATSGGAPSVVAAVASVERKARAVATFAELQRMHASGGTEAVECQGQVIQRRCHGDRVCFFDLLERPRRHGGESTDSVDAKDLVELVADERNFTTVEGEARQGDVRRVFRSVHLGDIVRAWGKLRSADEVVIEITGIEVLESWKVMAGPDDAFHLKVVRPPPRADPAWRRARPEAARPCKFFVSQGICEREGCTFLHVPGTKTEWTEALKKRRALASQHPDDPHGALDKGAHRQRAQVFARWIVETYDLEALRSGGVLDVAGGRGELAFELTFGFGIPVTVVDPRPLKLSRPQFKRLKQMGLAGEAAKLWLSDSIPSIQALLNEEFLEDPERRRLLETAAVVVGLHPDEATGAICESALRHGRPFAVVPCCVFSDHFPERKVREDSVERTVRTHEDLCQWLLGQGPRIEECFLNFEGKNRVVFARAAQPA